MMKVLWITNIMLPPLCQELNLPIPVIGGWMYSSAKRLKMTFPLLKLAVATVYSGKSYLRYVIDDTIYYLLPLKGKNMQKYHKHLEEYWRDVYSEFTPALVHLHGSEFPHGLAFLNACPEARTVVSIQGLVSVCARYYLGDMSFRDVLKNITFRDIVRCNNLWQQKNSFTKRGLIERKIIHKAGNVIGRTSWDKVHATAISTDIKYYHCNETLRDEFYRHTWIYEKCEKHSIFLSQAGYPVKGFHKLLMALPLVIREFPDVKVYVAGFDIRCVDSLKSRLRRGGYGQYILSLIEHLKIANHITFMGVLSEKQMCEQYLKANVFVCPSSIENSPNSLGEAQLMGVPCIASYVGGIPDMMEGYEYGSVYRYEEFEMLAEEIITFFLRHDYSSDSGIVMARRRHDKKLNAERTLEIYKQLIFSDMK